MSTARIKAWLSAARLRTLPLSISGIVTGTAYGCGYILGNHGTVDYWVPALALITTLSFQVLSNFANDYGDGVKGTDNAERIGPVRALQSGTITAPQMRNAIIITAIISFISAVLLIYISLGVKAIGASLFFLTLGILAIWAAIKYTVGKNAYGYRGLGDVFVFVFFGPVSVLGVFYLLTKTLLPALFLPSITIGLLSVAVLHLNNMRDMVSDAKSGKNTIVVKLGIAKAKSVHLIFLSMAFLSALGIAFIGTESGHELRLTNLLPLLAFIPLGVHARLVFKNSNPAGLDPELKKVALSTFCYALLTLLSVFI